MAAVSIRWASACAAAIVMASIRFGAQPAPRLPTLSVPLQPVAQQARRLETALTYLGQPLSSNDHQAIDQAISMTDEEEAVQQIQTTLDRHVLAVVRIN